MVVRTNRAEARRCEACKQVFSGQARFCPFDGERLVDAPEWDPADDPLIGKKIDGRYLVLEVLGEGETGKVYKVQHVALGRRFALKVLRPDFARDADMVARFIREAQAAAAIGHPNIIAVSDFGELPAEEGSGKRPLPYFVMEYLTGVSLAGLLQIEGPMKPARAGPIFAQVAGALSAAHAAGVIHRNLKPANIFITRTGEHDFSKLLDFGVAKIVGTGRKTKVGLISGTPHYMSPEQATGATIDQRVDVYALGVIMYECFTGRPPFEAETYAEVLRKHAHEEPAPIEERAADRAALGAFAGITMRCLAKKPSERFASMAELAAVLESAAAPIVAGSAIGVKRGQGKSGGRSTGVWVAGVALVVAMIGGLVVWRSLRGEPGGQVAAPPPTESASGARPNESVLAARPTESAPAVTSSAASSGPPAEPPPTPSVAPSVSASAPPAPSPTLSGSSKSPLTSPFSTNRPGGTSSKPPPGGLVDPWATRPK